MSNKKHIIFRLTDARSRRFHGTQASKTQVTLLIFGIRKRCLKCENIKKCCKNWLKDIVI